LVVQPDKTFSIGNDAASKGSGFEMDLLEMDPLPSQRADNGYYLAQNAQF